jgi:hypothetical protein
MNVCCPPGEGCNSRSGQEPCALSRLRRCHTPEAERALRLWTRYLQTRGTIARQRRVARRAYVRTRDRALGLWTPWGSISV